MRRFEIVEAARTWLGTPYLHQASLKGIGCDCLGLVRGVWREVVGEEPEPVPAYSPDWAEAGKCERLAEAGTRHLVPISAGAFGPGDVLLFRWRPHLPAKHAAIASGLTSMIHAQSGAVASEVAITGWWLRRLAYVFHFPTLSDD
jgi:NlpC/P60 family putative phage cell wall peptidase